MVLFNLQSACDRFYSVLRPVIKGLTSFPERPLSRVPDYNTTPIPICQHLFSNFFALFSSFWKFSKVYSNKGLRFQIPVVFHRVLKLCVFVYRKTASQTWLRSGLWTALFKKIFQTCRNFSLCILAANSIKLIQGTHCLNFWKLRQDPLLNQI